MQDRATRTPKAISLHVQDPEHPSHYHTQQEMLSMPLKDFTDELQAIHDVPWDRTFCFCCSLRCTGRPPLVYGFNGIPFIVLIRTLYGKLLKRSPCARGHTYTDRRALTVFLYGEKMNRDSSDSNERESVRPQPKRRMRETIFCSHCDRLVPKST